MFRSCQVSTALESLFRSLGAQAHLGAAYYATTAVDIGAGVSNPAVAAPRNRFYEHVSIQQAEAKVGNFLRTTLATQLAAGSPVRYPVLQNGFEVTLDGKPLKSPARKDFVLPTKSLALAIAAEWEWQV